MAGKNLSPRQEEIAPLLGQGATYRQIGDKLHISERTVKYHVDRLKFMYGAGNRFELVQLLQKDGVI